MRVFAFFSFVRLCRQMTKGDGNTSLLNSPECLTAKMLYLEKELNEIKRERDRLIQQHHILIQHAQRKESNTRDPEAG